MICMNKCHGILNSSVEILMVFSQQLEPEKWRRDGQSEQGMKWGR